MADEERTSFLETWRRVQPVHLIMTGFSQEQLDEIYGFAVELGKDAGQMLLDAARLRMGDGGRSAGQKEHVEKENAVDLVTETDEGTLFRSEDNLRGIFGILCHGAKPCSCRGVHKERDNEEISESQVSISKCGPFCSFQLTVP